MGLGSNLDGGGVDAEALAGRLGSVGEYVTQVAAAAVAADLDPDHAVALVDNALDDLAVDRLVVARPAAAGVKLGAAFEERRAAADAVVAAVVEVIPVLAGESALGGGVAGHLVLHAVELGTPFCVALAHRVAGVVVVVGTHGANCAWLVKSGRVCPLSRA